MITKRRMKGGKFRVTFAMPGTEGVTGLFLAGDFNGWDQRALPMEADDNGGWSVAVTLESDREYQYRFVTADGVWHNDPEADAYVSSGVGSENCVLRLPGEEPEKPKRGSPKSQGASKA
jgi:1,4-alpha-glucan branching enzyme